MVRSVDGTPSVPSGNQHTHTQAAPKLQELSAKVVAVAGRHAETTKSGHVPVFSLNPPGEFEKVNAFVLKRLSF